MHRKTIVLTESKLFDLIVESMQATFGGEEMTPTQTRNILGIYDDDELNASVDSEESENLQQKIFTAITERLCGGNSPRRHPIRFDELVKLLGEFGFKYVGPDESRECHDFENDRFRLVIWPTNFYEKQGTMTVFNMLVV